MQVFSLFVSGILLLKMIYYTTDKNLEENFYDIRYSADGTAAEKITIQL